MKSAFRYSYEFQVSRCAFVVSRGDCRCLSNVKHKRETLFFDLCRGERMRRFHIVAHIG
jgi:hypothetical protein